ncbi:MAG TPA: MaoC family dehydratase N-terminal domain-containing protein [Methylomirabilota bacterium]|jgi:3-methylfumaryl-CoA hydratase|nr:MaoC family dehydratase N-terminal domain-containing protein [Methylomirabilota bacterium]
MTTIELDLENLKRHVGRRLISTDVVTAGPANLLRLTFGRPDAELQPGDVLPPGWHNLYFLPLFGPEELRPDGSPRDAGVVPSMPLPRRMFAGERLRFHRPIRVGDELRRETELTDIAVKRGGTGTLVFATVVNRIFVPGGLALEEERRTVFREEVKPGERNQAPRREEAPSDVPWRRRMEPDPILLFRFSALTFNSHRIHYDRRWAMEAEGYSGLVVHGPLTSLLLIDFARDHHPQRAFAGYSAEARAPLFDTAPFELRGRPAADGRSALLWAVTPEGTVAMSAQVELAA